MANESVQASAIGQQLVARLTAIPWGHNLVIVSKCREHTEALYYIQTLRGKLPSIEQLEAELGGEDGG